MVTKALSLSGATETRVVLSESRAGSVRWARRGILAGGETRDRTLTITATVGSRRAAVTTNRDDAASLESAVKRAEALAREGPEDPEYVPEEGPAAVAELPAWFSDTAEAGAAYRAEAAKAALDAAGVIGGSSSGWFETGESLLAVGTSRGFFALHRQTRAVLTVRVRAKDGTATGLAGRDEVRLGAIRPAAIATEAAGIAERGSDAREAEPGAYAVVLHPEAVAALIPLLLFSLDARLAHEGRSCFSKPGGGDRIGERLFGAPITLLSDPADPMLLSAPFSAEGTRRERRIWIQSGMLRDLSFSRWWGGRRGGRPSGGISTALLLGGNSSIDAMIGGTEKGLLIRRLDYVNMLDPMRLQVTGVTRDGTFLIEGGKVAGPVRSLRFDDSLFSILSSVESLGVPERVVGDPVMAMPPIKVRSMRFSGPAGRA